jgi:hypothetical protein
VGKDKIRLIAKRMGCDRRDIQGEPTGRCTLEYFEAEVENLNERERGMELKKLRNAVRGVFEVGFRAAGLGRTKEGQ